MYKFNTIIIFIIYIHNTFLKICMMSVQKNTRTYIPTQRVEIISSLKSYYNNYCLHYNSKVLIRFFRKCSFYTLYVRVLKIKLLYFYSKIILCGFKTILILSIGIYIMHRILLVLIEKPVILNGLYEFC